MKLSPLDKVFGELLICAYKNDALNKIGVSQVMDLRRAFYAGARVMVDAAYAEPPLTDAEEQDLLVNIDDFDTHIKNEAHNRILAAAILVQAQMKVNGASTN